MAGLIVDRPILTVSGLSLVAAYAIFIAVRPAEILFFMGLDPQRGKPRHIVPLPALPGMAAFAGSRQVVRMHGGAPLFFSYDVVTGMAVMAPGTGPNLRLLSMAVVLVMTLAAMDGPRPRAGLMAFVLHLGVAVPAAQILSVGGVPEFCHRHGARAWTALAMAAKTLLHRIGPD